MSGSPMFKLFEKIKQCRLRLVAWSCMTFGKTKFKIEEKQREMEELINLGYAYNLEQIHNKREELNNLMHQEEVFWRQHLRVIWLPTSNKNKKFFHKRASQRKRKNQIEGLMDEGGVWRSGEENIVGVAKRYFTNLFSTSNPNTIDDMLESVEAVVTEDMNESLLLPFNGVEVYKVLFQMHPLKSSGPDSMSPFFFQKFWHIVRDDVTEAV